VPLSINCWPSVSGGESYVNIEYEATADFDLQNVVISIPLPALSQAPRVPQARQMLEHSGLFFQQPKIAAHPISKWQLNGFLCACSFVYCSSSHPYKGLIARCLPLEHLLFVHSIQTCASLCAD